MEKTAKHKNIDILTAILIVIIIAVGALSVMCCITQYEKIAELKTLNRQLAEAQNEGELLKIKYEERTNYRAVEDYAVNRLGMIKINNYQIEYIVSKNSNQTLLIAAEEEDAGILPRISRAFSVAMDYFK
ncbi:MAG: hypothetical protein IJL30_00710 [Clostridia bacterium]|nr:hypothetical protein [Clostridia bacterium]